ncbi:MAG: HAMP domain-containing sensor histidine kinase [Rubrivivax sp.]
MNQVRLLPSIRARLSAQLVVVALAGGLLMALAVWLAVRQEVDELLDETLQASAEVLGALLASGPTATPPASPAQGEHFAWQLVGPGGTVLLRSARAPDKPWQPLRAPGFSDAPSGWRVYGLALAGGERMLYVAQTDAERREAETEVVISASWAALALALLGAWWLRRHVRRELRPLALLGDEVVRYDPLQEGAALAPATRRELQAVQEAIEALGRRLARRVANERAFSAHAAHALRTPLAGIDMQLAVAQREAPDALQPRLARVREAAGRLTRVVSALLALFRSGAEPDSQRIALAPLLQRLPHEQLALQADPAAVLHADEDLLSAALINLLDNAVRHGAHRVQVELQHSGHEQQLRLHDDGRGVPPERRAELAEALATQSYEGRMGLGLMLADLVARAHGGQLRLPEVAQGFCAELVLRLPEDAAPAKDTAP